MRRTICRLCFLLLMLGTAAAPFVAVAQAPLTPAQVGEVRAVVRGQLEAFAADDAGRAFSFAAANVREMFRTPERFMEMVRAGYPAVYRPATVTFMVPESTADGVLQRVHLTDQSGASWVATYLLQRQEDKSLRISACVLVPSQGRTT